MPCYAPGDVEILKAACDLGFVRARDIAFTTGRSIRVAQRRLAALGPDRIASTGKEVKGEGFLRSVPGPTNPFERVWFLTQRGWDECLRLRLIDSAVNAADEKSDGYEHDLVATDLVVELMNLQRQGVIEDLQFTRRRSRLEDGNFRPDLFFSFKYRGVYVNFFVEIENSSLHSYDVDGIPSRLRKAHRYADYTAEEFAEKWGGDDYFVLFLLYSARTAANFRQLLRQSGNGILQSRKFWIADYSAIRQLAEKVFKTPKDEALSLLDAAGFVD